MQLKVDLKAKVKLLKHKRCVGPRARLLALGLPACS